MRNRNTYASNRDTAIGNNAQNHRMIYRFVPGDPLPIINSTAERLCVAREIPRSDRDQTIGIRRKEPLGPIARRMATSNPSLERQPRSSLSSSSPGTSKATPRSFWGGPSFKCTPLTGADPNKEGNVTYSHNFSVSVSGKHF